MVIYLGQLLACLIIYNSFLLLLADFLEHWIESPEYPEEPVYVYRENTEN